MITDLNKQILCFAACFTAVLLLTVSWVWAPTAQIWQSVDNATFFALNGSLTQGSAWSIFWAYMNIDLANVLAGVFMVVLLLYYVATNPDDTLPRKLASFTVIALFVCLGIIISKSGFRDFVHHSPSLVLEPFNDLNKLTEGIEAKVRSRSSFPGDHGVTTFIYSLLVVLLIKSRTIATLAVLFALLNNLPRLFSGAHWLSDVLVGGGGITLLLLPFAIATPIPFYIEKIWGLLFGRFPILAKLAAKLNGPRL